MVGTIAFPKPARVMGTVRRVRRSKAANAARRQQFLLDLVQNMLGPGCRRQRVRQAQSQYLVGTDRGVALLPINYIEEASRFFIPEHGPETRLSAVRQLAVFLLRGRILQCQSEVLHDPECVVPERLNLYRHAPSRSYRAVADLRIHPGELGPGLAAIQEAKLIHVNAEPRAAEVPVNDTLAD